MTTITSQLTMFGLDETIRRAEAEAANEAERRRARQRVEIAHDVMSALPEEDDLRYQHSGLCQTFLPHSRPKTDEAVWERQSGAFLLSVSPGRLGGKWVGVPFGAKARLIMIHLQTEGMKSRTVHLGDSLTAFLRALGLAANGGRGGTIPAVREQCIRLMRCKFTLEWTEKNPGRVGIQDIAIADKQLLWTGEEKGDWSATLELSESFHHHLRQHAVPLDKRGIAHLAGNSFGLDLYTLLAYRLPQLRAPTFIRWSSLMGQMGAGYSSPRDLAKRVRAVLPDVLVAYPHAKLEALPTGLKLFPSNPSVPPKTQVSGFRVIEGEPTKKRLVLR